MASGLNLSHSSVSMFLFLFTRWHSKFHFLQCLCLCPCWDFSFQFRMSLCSFFSLLCLARSNTMTSSPAADFTWLIIVAVQYNVHVWPQLISLRGPTGSRLRGWALYTVHWSSKPNNWRIARSADLQCIFFSQNSTQQVCALAVNRSIIDHSMQEVYSIRDAILVKRSTLCRQKNHTGTQRTLPSAQNRYPAWRLRKVCGSGSTCRSTGQQQWHCTCSISTHSHLITCIVGLILCNIPSHFLFNLSVVYFCGFLHLS